LIIGLVIYGSIDTISGGYLYDRKLVEYLREAGDQVKIISLPWKSYWLNLFDNLSPRLINEMGGLTMDILLQDELAHPSLFALNQRLKKQNGIPIVTVVHHLRSSESLPAIPKWLNTQIEKHYLRSVDGLILNSKSTYHTVESMLEEQGKKEQKKLLDNSVIAYPAGDRFQPAIELDWIERKAREPGPLRIVFVGNVIPRKAVDTLLEALTMIREENWELTICGSLEFDPAYATRMQRLVSLRALSRKVIFTGKISDIELANVFMQGQILVVPSMYEGFGIAYLEGMSFGLPAIATNRGGAVEMITHGIDGILVEPNHHRNLAELILRLINDRDELARISVAARKRFLAQPTWRQTGSRVREFLVRLTNPGNNQQVGIK